VLLNESMRRVRIIVLKREADAVTEALGRLGVLELTRAAEEAPSPAPPPASAEMIRECEELRRELMGLMERLGVGTGSGGPEGERGPLSLQQARAVLETVRREAEPHLKKLEELERERALAAEQAELLAPYRELDVPPSELARVSFLHVAVGDMPEDHIPLARDELPGNAVLAPVGWPRQEAGPRRGTVALRRVLVISSRRSRFAVRTVLDNHGFNRQELPADVSASPAALYQQERRRAEALRASAKRLRSPLLELGAAHAAELRAALRAATRELEKRRAEQNYASTWAVAIVTGWCPASRVEQVRETVRRVTGGRAVFESREPTPEEVESGLVPCHAPLPGVLRPFQRLVRGFGVPGYREIEPTLLFAVSFLLMFGVMFGDLGHGVCLLLAGLLVRRRSVRPAGKDLGYLIATAGLTSALFGALFQGTFFGTSLSRWGWSLTLGLEPLRLGESGADPAASVMRYLAFSIALGGCLVSLGVLLNIIARVRTGQYEAGLLGRFGLAGFIFYWGALGIAAKIALMGRGWMDVWLAVALVALPLLVLAFHEPLYAMLAGLPHPERSPAKILSEALLEMWDTVTTYVANTFSFLRVAAFALSHVALCFTIFVMQGIVEELPGGALWSVLVFVVGTVVVLGLEGLVVGIQVLRLEYYEFFSKFLQGGGREFAPFHLDAVR